MSKNCEQNWNAVKNDEDCHLMAKCWYIEYYCLTVCEGFVICNIDLPSLVEVDELNSSILVVKDMQAFISKEDLTEIRDKLKPQMVLTEFCLRLFKKDFNDHATYIFDSIDKYIPYLFDKCLTGDSRRTHMIKALNSQMVLRLIDGNQKRLALKLFRTFEAKDGLNYEADVKRALFCSAVKPDFLHYSNFILEMKELVKSVIQTFEKPLILVLAALISMHDVRMSGKELLKNFSEFLGRKFEKKGSKEHGSQEENHAKFSSKDVSSWLQVGSSSSKIVFKEQSRENDELKESFLDLDSTQDYHSPPFQIIESTQTDHKPDNYLFIDNLRNQIWFSGSDEKMKIKECQKPPKRPSRITPKKDACLQKREESFKNKSEVQSVGKMSSKNETKSDNPAEGIDKTSIMFKEPQRNATEKTAKLDSKKQSDPQKETVYLDLPSLANKSNLQATKSHGKAKAAKSLAEMISRSSRKCLHDEQSTCLSSCSNNDTWPQRKQVRYEINEKISNISRDKSSSTKFCSSFPRKNKSKTSATVTSASQVRSSDEEQELSGDEVESLRKNSSEKKKEHGSSFDRYVSWDLSANADYRKDEGQTETHSNAITEGGAASQNFYSKPLQSKNAQSTLLAKESGNGLKSFLSMSKERDICHSSPKRKEHEEDKSIKMKKTGPLQSEEESFKSNKEADKCTDKGQRTTSLSNAGKRDCEKPKPENFLEARRKRRRLLLNGNIKQSNDFKTMEKTNPDVRTGQKERGDKYGGFEISQSDSEIDSKVSDEENVDMEEHDSSFVLQLSPVIEYKSTRDNIDVIGHRYDLRTSSPKKISNGDEGMAVPNGPNQDGGNSNKPVENSKQSKRTVDLEDENELDGGKEGEVERVIQSVERQNDQIDDDPPAANIHDANNEVNNQRQQNEDAVNNEEQSDRDNELNNQEQQNEDNEIDNEEQPNRDNEVSNHRQRNRYNHINNLRLIANMVYARMERQRLNIQRQANEDSDSGESVRWSSEDDDDRIASLNRYFDRRIARAEARDRVFEQAEPPLPVHDQPRRAQEQPRRAQEQPRRAQEQPRGAQEQPRRAQEQPRRPQEQPRRPQEQPRRPQEQPRRPQEQPRRPQGQLRRLPGRRRFTMDEEDWLRDGVRRFGTGNWSTILANYRFNRRTAVNLKDKWRNMVRNGATGF